MRVGGKWGGGVKKLLLKCIRNLMNLHIENKVGCFYIYLGRKGG